MVCLSLPRGCREEHAKAPSEIEAGSLSSLESMKGCVSPGEMSDKLLGWSLEKVVSSRSTPQGKDSCNGGIRKLGRTSAMGGAGQERQSQKCERCLECR